MELVRMTEVRKRYGSGESQVRALDGVSLKLERGEFAAVTGASGSGKSTLLHILGTVDRADSGTVMVDGVDLRSLNAASSAVFRRRKVGLVYQFYNLIPTVNVEKNILMPLLLDRRKPDPAYFEEIVRALGLRDKLHALPHQLSGGQQQRAAIARSLIYRPALLLADEPTGNLDRKNSGEVLDLLTLLNRRLNQTILMVTHDEPMALSADRMITLADGRIVSDRRRR